MYQKNAVIGQNANNMLKTTEGQMGCIGDMNINCQYTGTYTQANTVSAITIEEDGADVVIPLTIAANATAEAVKTAIDAALVAKDYYDDDNADWPGITVTDLGSTLQIVITGNIKVKTMTASGGASTFDADCKVENVCTFTANGFTAGAGSAVKINGSTQSLGSLVPGTQTAGDVKTAVETAFANEGFTVVATVVAPGTLYNISLTPMPSTATIYFTGASGVKFYADASNCVQTYN